MVDTTAQSLFRVRKSHTCPLWLGASSYRSPLQGTMWGGGHVAHRLA